MTTHASSIAAALLAGALLGSCTGAGDSRVGQSASARAGASAPTDTVPSVANAARARSAANALGKDLQAKLFAALDSGGPAGAIGICADSAQTWSARHASEGVSVRRVSLRARNPQNRPDPAEERELKRLDSLHGAGVLPSEVLRYEEVEGERIVQYSRPILVQARCLACHGAPERIAPEIRTFLADRYPEDRATGYAEGELRGMISVRVRP